MWPGWEVLGEEGRGEKGERAMVFTVHSEQERRGMMRGRRFENTNVDSAVRLQFIAAGYNPRFVEGVGNGVCVVFFLAWWRFVAPWRDL